MPAAREEACGRDGNRTVGQARREEHLLQSGWQLAAANEGAENRVVREPIARRARRCGQCPTRPTRSRRAVRSCRSRLAACRNSMTPGTVPIACSSCVARSRGSELNSYRSPRFSVKRLVSLSSSWMKPVHRKRVEDAGRCPQPALPHLRRRHIEQQLFEVHPPVVPGGRHLPDVIHEVRCECLRRT